jgi:hypothetical protein
MTRDGRQGQRSNGPIMSHSKEKRREEIKQIVRKRRAIRLIFKKQGQSTSLFFLHEI